MLSLSWDDVIWALFHNSSRFLNKKKQDTMRYRCILLTWCFSLALFLISDSKCLCLNYARCCATWSKIATRMVLCLTSQFLKLAWICCFALQLWVLHFTVKKQNQLTQKPRQPNTKVKQTFPNYIANKLTSYEAPTPLDVLVSTLTYVYNKTKWRLIV